MNTPLLLASELPSFTWWGAVGLFDGVPHYFIMGWTVAILLIALSFVVNRSVKKYALVPRAPEEMSLGDWIREGFEGLVAYFMELVDGLMPHHREGRRFLWLIVPMFVYILVSNLFGLTPGFLPPTDNVNTNGAVAISVFVLYNAIGVAAVGASYLKHFWAPAGLGFMGLLIGPLLGGIELFSHTFRPITLSLRLYGNISGDHAVFSAFLSLVPIGVPIVFLVLGLLISTIQAFVFTLLTSVYIALATSHDH